MTLGPGGSDGDGVSDAVADGVGVGVMGLPDGSAPESLKAPDSLGPTLGATDGGAVPDATGD